MASGTTRSHPGIQLLNDRARLFQKIIVRLYLFRRPNANPFESESTDGGRVLEAAAASGRVSASPGGVSDGLSGELVKGLSDEMGASQSAVDQAGFATFLGDRRNAGIRLQFRGRLPAGAVGTQGNQQSWSEDRRAMALGLIGYSARKLYIMSA